MQLHFLSDLPWRCRFLPSTFSLSRTFPLLVSFFSACEALHRFFHLFLSPRFSHSTLHHSASQGFEPITPHCPLLCSLSFLHFWARCPKLLHFLQSLPSLPSNSALNLARARLSLSMLLMSLLYCSRDIVLCSGQVGAKGFVLLFEGLVMFFTYLTFTSAGVHYLHPARCLLPY